MNPKWIEKYKKKAFKTKMILLILTIIITILFTIFLILLSIDDNHYAAWLILTNITTPFLKIFLVSTILGFIFVKPIVFTIDGYNVVVYSGFFKDSLIIENNLIDSIFPSSFRQNYIYGKLPNNKKIAAILSPGKATIIETNDVFYTGK